MSYDYRGRPLTLTEFHEEIQRAVDLLKKSKHWENLTPYTKLGLATLADKFEHMVQYLPKKAPLPSSDR